MTDSVSLWLSWMALESDSSTETSSDVDSEPEVSTDTDSETDVETENNSDDSKTQDEGTEDVGTSSEKGVMFFVTHHVSALVGIALSILHIICGLIFRNSIPPEGLEVDILTESLKVFALYVGTLLCELSPILGLSGIGFNILNVKFKTKLCAVYNTVVACLSVFLLISANMIGK